jgi:hypothetical protein
MGSLVVSAGLFCEGLRESSHLPLIGPIHLGLDRFAFVIPSKTDMNPTNPTSDVCATYTSSFKQRVD